MKKFISHLFVFVSLSSILLAIPIAFMVSKSPDNIDTWYYGINSNKKNKIILAGSSNVYMNYDYQKLNNSFIDYDVVGASIAASAGFIPLISKLDQLDIKPNDIIIFCLPYEIYDKANFIIFNNELALKAFSKRTLKNGLKYNFSQTFINFYGQLDFISWFKYSVLEKEQINYNHDLKIELTQSNLLTQIDYISCVKQVDAKFDVISQDFDEQYISEFMKSILNNVNAEVYFRFPSVHKNKTDVNQNKLHFLNNNYRFINSYNTTEYDSVFWYNGKYHLNQCGAEKNTNTFISELKRLNF